jgi:hypothetical protein
VSDFGLIPICLKLGNLNLDEYHRNQIADFGQNRLDLCENGAIVPGATFEFAVYEMQSGEGTVY